MSSADCFVHGYTAIRAPYAPMKCIERKFAEIVAGKPRGLVDLPTATGKTELVVIWLLAAALIQTLCSGGGRGIRTPVRVSPQTVFKTAGFNHSPIPPPSKITWTLMPAAAREDKRQAPVYCTCRTWIFTGALQSR
jgi:hypothetical protein